MKSLKIQNLILVDLAEIHFGPGLNIFTGETGAGKSAILMAIRLIAGERADQHLIRKGAEMAFVEAQMDDDRFIRREIYRSGKNRCFIDDAQVSLSALRDAVAIEIVDQNSSILSGEKKLLDLFASIDLDDFEKSVAEEKGCDSELQTLLQIPKDRELEWAKKDLELIDEVEWREEAKLNAEHEFLYAAQETLSKIDSVASALTEGGEIPQLRRMLAVLESCVKFNPKLEESARAMRGALLELEESGRFLQSYANTLEADPARLEWIEKKISAIVNLKRRFGTDIEGQKQKLSASLESLMNLDAQIELLQKRKEILSEKNQKWRESITAKRKEMAPLFAKQVLEELISLNLQDAQFEIQVKETFNDISFLFSANRGHPPLPIQDCASGGELSRLLLAIKTILADGKSTLVFDEIDSNVGGQTATVLGEKLKRLSEKSQLICVTHFVQVAKCAIDHFLVAKQVDGESTFTRIQKLSDTEKEIEYKRMLGLIQL